MAPSGGMPGAAVPATLPMPEAAPPVETGTQVEQAQPVEAVRPPTPLAAAAGTELPTVIGSSAGEEVAAVEPPDAKSVEPVTEARAVEAEPVQVTPPEVQAVEARELRPPPPLAAPTEAEMAAVEPPAAKPVEPATEARAVEAEPVQVTPPRLSRSRRGSCGRPRRRRQSPWFGQGRARWPSFLRPRPSRAHPRRHRSLLPRPSSRPPSPRLPPHRPARHRVLRDRRAPVPWRTRAAMAAPPGAARPAPRPTM